MRRLSSALLLGLFASVAIAVPKGPGGWEMTTYQVGFLKKGPSWTPGETPELRTSR
jgi:hypothetical protein